MGRLTGVVLLAITAPASAQSLNVSFTAGSGPSSGYAAAGGAGVWNAVTGVAGPSYNLVGIDGSPSGVAMTQSPTTTLITATDASVSGDDATLLDHGLVTTGAETCLSFNGFQPGSYEVLIYAWLPGQPTVKSRTRQDEAPMTIDVGGAWTGAHVAGVTYARYVVDVGSDGILPAHSGLAPSAPSAALNGVQIRPLASAGVDAGPRDGAGGGGGATDDAGTDPQPHGGGCNSGRTGGLAPGLLVLGFLLRRRRR
jgi:hypothetical protein